jgi:hypothetical protein
MKNIKNVYINKNDTRVIVSREGVKRSRRFLHSKFGGEELATKKAIEYRDYIKHEATLQQFDNAIRRPGRPSKSEFFGRRIIKN